MLTMRYYIPCAYFVVWFLLCVKDGICQTPLSEHKCKPRRTLVALDTTGRHLFPAFFWIHRCQGGSRHSSMFHCQPVETKDVNVQVIDLSGRKFPVKLVNHTVCEEACVCGLCRSGKKKPICDKDFAWNANECKCEHICPIVESEQSKQREHKGVKPSSTSGLSYKLVILLMFLELIVIGILAVACVKAKRYYVRNKNSANRLSIRKQNSYSSTET